MTTIRGGVAGPDGSGGQYSNEIETDRAAWWAALDGRSGVIRGMAVSTVPGSLALSLSAGSVLVAERDAAAVELNRGYFLWSDNATTVAFNSPSSGVRRDALVAAFIDVEDGPVGSGMSVGPQVLAIPGTSGSSTPLTSAAIQTALGRGGWLKLGDALISPGDTQILLANYTDANVSLNRPRTLPVSPATGWTINSAVYTMVTNNCFEVVVKATKTGTALTADTAGNYAPNIQLLSGLPSILTPAASVYGTFENDGAKGGGLEITSGGNMFLLWSLPSTTIAAGGTITARMIYTVAQV